MSAHHCPPLSSPLLTVLLVGVWAVLSGPSRRDLRDWIHYRLFTLYLSKMGSMRLNWHTCNCSSCRYIVCGYWRQTTPVHKTLCKHLGETHSVVDWTGSLWVQRASSKSCSQIKWVKWWISIVYLLCVYCWIWIRLCLQYSRCSYRGFTKMQSFEWIHFQSQDETPNVLNSDANSLLILPDGSFQTDTIWSICFM